MVNLKDFILDQNIDESDIDYKIAEQLANQMHYMSQLTGKFFTIFDYFKNKYYYISESNDFFSGLCRKELPGYELFVKELIEKLNTEKVTVLGAGDISKFKGVEKNENESLWFKEFLDYKILLGSAGSLAEAIKMINTYGGGHSASIVSENAKEVDHFLSAVDAAAVYHNASTRFTDGFQFGLGGELAISTDKLHQRGPIGLQHLVTNKWYVYGNGQIR